MLQLNIHLGKSIVWNDNVGDTCTKFVYNHILALVNMGLDMIIKIKINKKNKHSMVDLNESWIIMIQHLQKLMNIYDIAQCRENPVL